MKLTTLCYIEKENSYLMLHRIKKAEDCNKGKWIGVGGKLEENESPEECLVREVKEETGLTLLDYSLRGIITFVSDEWETEYMFLYTADHFEGELIECNEGELAWIDKNKVMDLRLWEGDRIFLQSLIDDEPFFEMKLSYKGEHLEECRKKGYRG